MSPLYPDMRKASAPLSITSGRCYMMPSKWPKSSSPHGPVVYHGGMPYNRPYGETI